MKKKVKKEIVIKTSLIKKLLIFLIIILVILTFLWISVNFIGGSENKKLQGELGSIGIMGFDPETGIYFPEECNEENFTVSWDSIFKESSENITIINNSDCTRYLLYKNISDIYYIITGVSMDGFGIRNLSVISFYTKLTSEGITDLESFDSANINQGGFDNFIDDLARGDLTENRSLDINITASADSEFSDNFRIDTGNFLDFGDSYGFTDNQAKAAGFVFKYIQIDYFHQIIGIEKTVNTTQTSNIPDVILYGSKRHDSVIYLEDYFDNLGFGSDELIFSYLVNKSGEFTLDMHDYYLHPVDFSTESTIGGIFLVNITLSYSGFENITSNNFNVKIYGCLDPDEKDIFEKRTSRNLSTSSMDHCVNNGTVREYYCKTNKILYSDFACENGYCDSGRCFINQEPDFESSECGDLVWEMNTNYILDIEECFDDEEDDVLIFKWEYPKDVSGNNTNITVKRNSTELILKPRKNWIGEAYFYIYANDSYNEEKSKVNCYIVQNQEDEESSEGDSGDEEVVLEENTSESVFKILYPNPEGTDITIFLGDEKTFSIANDDCDSIEWYLNEELVESDSKMYKAVGLEKGNYTVRVKIVRGDEIIDKTWNLFIEESVEEGRERIFNTGDVIFYTIVVVILVIIALILILLMSEKKSKNKKVKIGFGFVVVGDEKGKNNPSSIPGGN
ncbi:hypothetical protein GF386_01450 [Candidatus Pacearchaeota archaeon]|nr:hypothetical protein [Candidatus Pacearchaeota archaeon]MBD3282848.1 hypothetical protein [Candidatus Pacearchaeota archaeon]